jgi:disulfide bond formation protein DsbB
MVIISNKIILVLLLLASGSALVIAFTAQVAFDLEPCILCKYQRIPYFATILFSCLALYIRELDRRGALKVIGLIFLLSAVLSFYHNGVEQHWWTSVAGCSNLTGTLLNFQEFQNQLFAKMPKRCDQIDWTLFGLSLTVYNCAASIIFALLSFFGGDILKKIIRKRG